MQLLYYSLTLIIDFLSNSEIVIKDKKEGFIYIKQLIDAEFEQAITFFWFCVSAIIVSNSIPNQKTCKKNCFQDIPMSQEEIDIYKQKSVEFFEKECDKGNEYILFFYIDVLFLTLKSFQNQLILLIPISFLNQMISFRLISFLNQLILLTLKSFLNQMILHIPKNFLNQLISLIRTFFLKHWFPISHLCK